MNPALLGLLGTLRPSSPQRGLAPEQVQDADFASLLEKARNGEVASGREVTLARNAGVRLNSEQLAKIAAAADQAEARGVSRALVLIDGMALRLDVGMREITGAADLKNAGILTDIDAVVNIPAGQNQPSILPVPHAPAGLGNTTLLKVLADASPRPQQDAA